MWFGACTSSIGTWMQILAQSWLVYQLTKSSVFLGLDTFFAQIPIFLLSLFGGVFADRKSRRGLLIASQVIQLVSALVLAALVGTHVVRIWHILCLSLVTGIAQSFGGPAYSALVPTLVDKEDLQNAIALNSIQFNLARVVGPALGGLALVKVGATWCFLLNGISFLAVIASLLMIRTRFIPVKTEASVIKSMREGIHFLLKREGMISLVALAFFGTLLSFPLITFLPIMARDVFHGGPNVFTLLLCVSGAGSILGALSVAASGQKANQAKRSISFMLLLGILMIGFGLSRNLALSASLVFASGAALMIVFAINSSLVQLYTTDEMRGRVMSVYNVAFRGGIPLGSLISGLLIKQTSAPVIMLGNGVLVVLLAIYFLIAGRKVIRL